MMKLIYMIQDIKKKLYNLLKKIKEKEKIKMEISKVKQALIEQRKMNLSGNLYHKTQKKRDSKLSP